MMAGSSEEYVVFTGRPNAGKSSIIRAITGLQVPVGKQPGTTTSIDMFPIARGLTLVDMPGYGRKAGASRRWEDMTKDRILDFLEGNSERIVLAVHVLDITTFLETEERLDRKGYVSVDVEMVGYLHETLGGFPLVAANKIDKGREEDVVRNLEAFIDRISGGTPDMVSGRVFPVSAKTGAGVGLLKDAFHRRLSERGYLSPFELVG